MAYIFSYPVCHSEQADEDFKLREYTYSAKYLPTNEIFHRSVWVKNDNDFYKLLAHWNWSSGDWKYTAIVS